MELIFSLLDSGPFGSSRYVLGSADDFTSCHFRMPTCKVGFLSDLEVCPADHADGGRLYLPSSQETLQLKLQPALFKKTQAASFKSH